MNAYKMGRDINGNKTVRVIPSTGRGFSIQTNGNLPETDRNGVGVWTAAEVQMYVKEFGTPRQRSIVDMPAAPYQPKTGAACSCRPGQQRDNCPACEGTGLRIDFAAIRARRA